MKNVLLFLFLTGCGTLAAQPSAGLLAYFPFNGDLTDVTGNSANTGQHSGNPSYLCGIEETSLAFNGAADRVNLVGPLTQEFNVEDFSLSFYFKSTGSAGAQYLMSKRRVDCAGDYAFYIRFNPSTYTINAVMFENQNKNISLVHRLDAGKCWHHVALVRDNNRIKLYINGELAQEGVTVGRINIDNDGPLVLGSTDCFGPNETNFNGLLDELRFFNRTLRPDEVRSLYLRPDMIRTADTLIFLGNSVDIRLQSSCGAEFNWSSADGLSDPSAPEPTITPTKPGFNVYTVRIGDDVSSCVASDSITINVIDPGDLDCRIVYLPNAFTPNGDGLNDTYGISNPYALQSLISFEIFDRWGGRIFYTQNPFERWDGSYRGTALNSGVLLWKVVYQCDNEEKVATGNLTILR